MSEPESPPVALDAEQVAAARHVRDAVAGLLTSGSGVSGPLGEADLSRAVHGARAAKLHRLARGGTRLLRGLHDLQANRSQFTLPGFADDLRETLLVARALQGGSADDRWVGTGRRAYLPIGSLRLWGLFTEPIVAGSGHAGVSTVLCDASGRTWTVSDVLPGTPDYVYAAYDNPARIGGTNLSHRRLGRDGLWLDGATGSWDGRLGAGQSVMARRAGASSWEEEAPAALFALPFAEQVHRALASERGPAGDLVFTVVVARGAHKEALIADVPGGPSLRLVAPVDHTDLAWRDNLRLLARAPGLSLRVVGRVLPDRPRTLALLAIGPAQAVDPTAPVLNLPEVWAGRANVGLDRLSPALVEGAQPRPVEVEVQASAEPPDPLEALRRRLQRAVLGGAGTIPAEALGRIEVEARDLERLLMPTAAAALRGLGAGSRPGADFAEAWLAAAIAEEAAGRALARSAWL